MRHRSAMCLVLGGLCLLTALTSTVSPPPARGDVAPPAAGSSSEPPWRERRRSELGVFRRAEVRVSPEDWPAEPPDPTGNLDAARFAEAIGTLCGRMRDRTARTLGDAILARATQFGVEPFLLGALVHSESGCKSRDAEFGGIGLTHLPFDAHRRHLRSGVYRYPVFAGGQWATRELTLDEFPFTGAHLRRLDAHLYFAAGILRVLRDQHASIHRAFPEQAPHRHYVSHYIWGDTVRSDRPGDRVLTERRRLLQYYGAFTPPEPLQFRGLEVSAPLDGAPRVVLSWRGARRQNADGSRRPHRGTDIESSLGEPVRAAAAGRVVIAGVDLPGAAHHDDLTWREIREIDVDTLGAGGRFVCIQHDPPEGQNFRTCYMHLSRVHVERGDEVARGELIGTVGRTGIRNSTAHLHFEVRDFESNADGATVLAGHLIGHRPRRRSWW